MSLRLDNALVVDPAPERTRVMPDVSVHIEDGRVTTIGQARPEAAEVIDCAGCLVVPGLVNAHGHVPMTLFRGAADDLPLDRWLRERIWPAEAHLTRGMVEAGAQLGIAEMLAGGITAFADQYFFPDAVARVADRTGIRCLVGAPILDHPTPEAGPEEHLGLARTLLKAWPVDAERVRASIAPHSTYTCSAETLSAAAELADEHAAILQTHVNETRHEVYEVEARTGRRPIALLKETGCLHERSLLAHGGWTTKAEVRDIAEAGSALVHCPVANLKLATGGVAPVPELLAAGAAVALGTDGAASNNVLDLFETMKWTALLHKHHRWEADILPAHEVLALGTRVGAERLGLGAGRVEERAPADLAVIDLRKAHLRPLSDPISQIVYAAKAADVRTTVVAGKVLYHEGEHRTLDLQSAIVAAENATLALSQAAGSERTS